MNRDDILLHIREQSDRHCAELRAAADAEAAAIRIEAARTIEEMRRAALQSVREEADQLRERRYNALAFQATARRYERKAEALDQLWRDAASALADLARSERYPGILAALCDEVFAAAPEGSTILTAAADVAVVQDAVKRSGRKYSVQADDSVQGGVVAVWPDGHTKLTNTLSHRLVRFRDAGNEDVARVLFALCREGAE